MTSHTEPSLHQSLNDPPLPQEVAPVWCTEREKLSGSRNIHSTLPCGPYGLPQECSSWPCGLLCRPMWRPSHGLSAGDPGSFLAVPGSYQHGMPGMTCQPTMRRLVQTDFCLPSFRPPPYPVSPLVHSVFSVSSSHSVSWHPPASGSRDLIWNPTNPVPYVQNLDHVGAPFTFRPPFQ